MTERYIVTLKFDDGEVQVRNYKDYDKAIRCVNDYTYIVDSCISAHIKCVEE